jgi:ribose transport system ATP-binding protein
MRVIGVRTGAWPARRVDLELRSGEILGIAGLVGSGRTELARAMFGVDPVYGGSFELNGAPFDPRHTSEAVARGLFLVPEDRKGAGLLLDLPISQNISLPDMPHYARNFVVSGARETRVAEEQRRNLGIKAPQVSTRAASLSGGNQQKVVLAKWLAMSPKVMIFDEPTRGIDVGAKAEIYKLMRGLADQGVAVMMISSDMEEVIGVSDRIAVMHEGRIAGTLDRSEFSEENVLQLAVGQQAHQGGAAA